MFFFIILKTYFYSFKNNRPFHDNCGPVIGACAQTLPDGNILIKQNGNTLRCLQVLKSAK